jgi:uncharacterized membrane protein
MRGLVIGLTTLAILAGCSSSQDEASSPSNAAARETASNDGVGQVAAAGPPATAGLPEGYQARGQEPGWVLVIDRGRIAYAGDYGGKRISVTLPVPSARPDGITYATPQLTLRVHYRRCNDVMSGLGFEHEVEVVAAGEKLSGCGGERRPAWDL